MTVSRLIDLLRRYPDDMDVFHGYDCDGFPIEEARIETFNMLGRPIQQLILE